MAEPHLRGVMQTTQYDDRGQVIGVYFHCIACHQTWPDPDLDAAMSAKTSARGDRLTQEHWAVCPGQEDR